VHDFSEKVAVVTGAARGLGAAYARALAEKGAGIAVLDILADEADAVAADINAKGGRALAVATDVSDGNSFRAAIAATTQALGPVDILINNAGLGTTEQTQGVPWYDWPVEAWDKVVAVNMRGCFLGAQAVAPTMMEKGWGRIVNVSSATFWSPVVEAAHYVAAKGGVIGLTRALAAGLGEHGVTVNTLVPGLTRTEQMEQMYPAQVFEHYRQLRAIPRDAVPQDLVGAVLYLCSPASDFVTGQAFIVDGGHILD
jgi:NAD(P)-dependent dehydrogenase (short-subunit alcohol dehydrogenase family)